LPVAAGEPSRAKGLLAFSAAEEKSSLAAHDPAWARQWRSDTMSERRWLMTLVTRHAYAFEDLEIGMEASFAKTVSEADIIAFAEVTGDKNPVHLDRKFAEKTIFGKPIAHGMLTASYISAVFGMEMPGPGAIYISQTLNFRAPVTSGDQVIAKVRVMELYPMKRRARFHCLCLANGVAVLEGEAVLMVPARVAAAGWMERT
jgi:3-hydroxybutyryl-CoA dehydratase